MTEPRDTDVPGLAETVRDAQNRLQEHYKATSADIVSDQGAEAPVTLRLEFRGFSDLESAIETVTEVVADIDALPETTGVHAGFNSNGGYDHKTDETDDRPRGWVNADLDPALAGSDVECTCGPNEACHVCGGA